MRISSRLEIKACQRIVGATLAEVVIATGIVSVMGGSVLAGLSSGFLTLRMARENLRASQIMLEKVETIRLYTWDQINSNNFIPTSFTVSYDPNNVTNKGVTYTGTLTIGPSAVSSSYSNDLKLIQVHLSWKTGAVQRNRDFTTFYSRYGIQDYVY